MKKLLVITLIITLSVGLRGLLFHNDLIGAFPEGVDRIQIENHVVEGSVRFFMSKAHADLLFKEYEQSSVADLDKTQSLTHVENAIAELQQSIDNYQNAADTGARIGYHQARRQWFTSFDFGKFSDEHKLNRGIADEVSAYLSKGDIVGVYRRNIDLLNQIAATLRQIRDTLKKGDTPSVSLLWTLVRQYSETLLFGNYTTMMGTTVLGIHNQN